MGKKDKNKKKGKGAEKTLVKTDKKLVAKNKKLLQKLGEVWNFTMLPPNSQTFSRLTGRYPRNRRETRARTC